MMGHGDARRIGRENYDDEGRFAFFVQVRRFARICNEFVDLGDDPGNIIPRLLLMCACLFLECAHCRWIHCSCDQWRRGHSLNRRFTL